MFDTKAAVSRLIAIGIRPGVARDLVREVQKWSVSSKEEWTVARLKEFKLAMLKEFAGEITKPIPWVHYSRGRVPSGPFGSLFRLARNRNRGWVRAWNAVMVYSGFVFQDPELRVTRKQWRSAVSAIQRVQVSTDSLLEGLSMVHLSPLSVRVDIPERTGSRLVDYQSRPTRRAPIGRRTVVEEAGVLHLLPLSLTPQWTVNNWDILSGTLEGLENLVLPYVELNLIDEAKAGGDPVDDDLVPQMGLVALIQEAGYKLRFAANPFRVYQAALQPLGRALFRALRRVPNDFTFDQEAGVRLCQRFLLEGKPAVSMDLSNATDNSPLAFQLELLSKLGVETRWLQFFRETCMGRWEAHPTAHGPWETLRWTVGSPLGLFPTFASFALWHHSVVQWCFREMGFTPDLEGLYPYVILGDDVVVFEQAVAWLYRSVMERFGIPISLQKSLHSETTAEFAGRVITANAVVQGFKWKGRCSDQSFVDMARMIGPGAVSLMRHRQRRVIDYIADLPEPYGLGWNPFGIPLNERLTPQIERIWQRDERLRSFERRAARIHRYIFAQGMGPRYPGFTAEVSHLASDQEAARAVARLLPGWESWEEAIWPNLQEVVGYTDVPPDLAEDLRLMLQTTSSVETRKEASTLVTLERKVRRAVRMSR